MTRDEGTTAPCPFCGGRHTCRELATECAMETGDDNAFAWKLARELAEVLKKYHDRDDISHEPGVVDALAKAREAGVIK
jgi:hypothetical protein